MKTYVFLSSYVTFPEVSNQKKFWYKVEFELGLENGWDSNRRQWEGDFQEKKQSKAWRWKWAGVTGDLGPTEDRHHWGTLRPLMFEKSSRVCLESHRSHTAE